MAEESPFICVPIYRPLRPALGGTMSSCSARGQEFGHSDEVVRSSDHVAGELGASDSFVSGSTEAADSFCPTEDLFHSLSNSLADRITAVPRRSRVDGRTSSACRVAGHVRSDVHRAAVIDELERIVSLVTTDGDGPRTNECVLNHRQGGSPLPLSVGL